MFKLLYDSFIPKDVGWGYDSNISDEDNQVILNTPHVTLWGEQESYQYLITIIKQNNIYYHIDNCFYPLDNVTVYQHDFDLLVRDKFELIRIGEQDVQCYYGLCSYLLRNTSPLIGYPNTFDTGLLEYNTAMTNKGNVSFFPLYKLYSYIIDNDKLDTAISFFKKVVEQTDKEYVQLRQHILYQLKNNNPKHFKLLKGTKDSYHVEIDYPSNQTVVSFQVTCKLDNCSMITWVELDNCNTISSKIAKKNSLSIHYNNELYDEYVSSK